jgi:6-pyruvoyltetrahydropterin/6-carboxytetrahydropterin synthase
MDFGVLKERFGRWLELQWDHGMVLWNLDEEAIAAVRLLPSQKLFLLPYNPTAENLALYLLTVVGPHVLQDSGVRLTRVTVHETENGIAAAELE